MVSIQATCSCKQVVTDKGFPEELLFISQNDDYNSVVDIQYHLGKEHPS